MAVTKPDFIGGQPGRMGVTHREREELGDFDRKCFDLHALYVSYNVTSTLIV